MNHNLIINISRGITTQQGIGRMVELNKQLPYFPSAKHKEHSPEDMVGQNTEMSRLELCTAIMYAILSKYAKAYFATVQDDYPDNIDVLTNRLVRVEAQCKEQKKTLGDLVNHALGTKGGGSGTQRNMNSVNEATPQKSRKTSVGFTGGTKPGTGKGSGGTAASQQGSSGKKHCDLRNQFSQSTAKTHNTDTCFKWNQDGSKHEVRSNSGPGRKGKSSNKKYTNAIQKAKNLTKSTKKLKKKLKRSKRRRRSARSGYDSSSSSSSSSSSDDE